MRNSMVVFLFSFIAVLTTVQNGFTDQPVKGGDLKVGYGMFPSHFNAAIISGHAAIFPASQLFAFLLQVDENWQPLPYLAKKWEISDNGLTYTFHLVENATFHDGKPITSEDVAFSIDIVKNNHPFGVAMLKAVNNVETPDSHTAVFRLGKPHPALLLVLSTGLTPIIPKHIYGTGDIRQHPANLKPIGSGPFKFVEYKSGDYYILERYENFFRPGPYLNRIMAKLVRDPASAQIAFENQEFHYGSFTAGMRIPNFIRLKQGKDVVVTTDGYKAFGPFNFLEFNLRKAPFNDVRVRRAIAHAIDKDFITQKLHRGVSVKLDSPITHGSPFYTDDVKKYEYDLDKANKLLDEAGYPRKTSGMRFSATLDFMPGEPDFFQTPAEYLKPQLRKIGVDIEIRTSPDFATWAKRVGNWDHDLTVNAIYTWGDPVIGLHRLFLCDNIKKLIWTNTSGYCNPKADEVVNKAGEEMNPEKRKELYTQWQKIVTEDLPYIYLFEQFLFTVYNKNLGNVPMSVWGALAPFDRVFWKDGREPR